MTVINALIGIVKLVPIIDRWAQLFVRLYVEKHYADIRKEHREGISDAITKHDQRRLEDAYGHPNPGAPSGDAGSGIRPPRVRVPD